AVEPEPSMESEELEPSMEELEPEEPIVEIEEPEPIPYKEPELKEIEPESIEPISDEQDLREVEIALPLDYGSRLTLARTLLEKDELEEALVEYNELIIAEHELDQVLKDLKKAVTSRPEHVKTWQLLGDVYMLQDDLERALDAYHKALEQLD
ncbi:MAG: tetratricopeptide repeat protein, partial [Anaerolineales bacterium]|nr:tetratricopeptide repeat protein [Anaerolineales bacterium]